MDYTPQYVSDFLNNYYKLTKRVLSIIKLPGVILEADVVEGLPLFVEFNEETLNMTPSTKKKTYILNYETINGEIYHYWWRGDYININRNMSTLLKSIDNTLEYHRDRYGIIYYKSINTINELLDMSDDEFSLYIKMINLPVY